MNNNQKQNQKPLPYYLGLDVGTSSVGWAVTDRDYNVVKKGKKHLIGTRTFLAGVTAESTRVFRTARRRLKRRKQRLKLLQELFAEEINAIDPGFFQRMKDSFFFPEDKQTHQKYALFNDSSFTDYDYYHTYPTIYHLRHALMTEDHKFDIRLIYLAVHHILKYRGHFLFEGEGFTVSNQFDTVFNHLINVSKDFNIDLPEDASYKQAVQNILEMRSITASDKAKKLDALTTQTTKQIKELNKLIVGNKGKIHILLDDELLKELKSFDFSDYEEKRPEHMTNLGESIDLYDAAYDVYNWGKISSLLAGETSISSARINTYKKHNGDLKLLKSVVREIDRLNNSNDFYKKMFSQEGKDNYVAYIGKTLQSSKKKSITKCTYKDFKKCLKNTLESYAGQIDYVDDILNELELDQFLPKIKTTDNGVIPRQLHGQELKNILENASKHHPFLSKEIQKKIIDLFNFRIPYYIGPLNPAHSKNSNNPKFAWVIRKSEGAVTPWNFDTKIDRYASAKAFIDNLTNKCTYLYGEDVLPKHSQTYSEFMIRNSLNNLKIDGELLSIDLLESIYDELFVKKNAKVTKKRIADFLITRGVLQDSSQLSGIDDDIPHKLQSQHDFNTILGNQLCYEERERIILYVTLFGQEKKMLKKWLSDFYNDKLSPDQISKLATLHYDGWGKLSKKLLSGIKTILPGISTDEISILEAMRRAPLNLMELLSQNYNYAQLIEKENSTLFSDDSPFSIDLLDDLRLSPSVKKAVWQSLKICRELFKIMGGHPEKIFVEVTRENVADKKGKKTESRKDQLAKLYRNCKDDLWDVNNAESIEESNFKGKKLYLYYLQKGRCMYSGEEINYNALFNDNLYDIDHIYPRSQTKDDSFNNLVLVKSELNRKKSDDYPLPSSIQETMQSFWFELRAQGFISQEKFNRLVRKTELTPDDLNRFINRQLVETGQSTKALAQLLGRLCENSRVVYVKAGLVSDFRYEEGNDSSYQTRFFFPKLREINDIHHAHDAYLNIVVGNVYDIKFTKDPFNFIKGAKKEDRRITKIFQYDVARGKETAWISGNDGTAATVKKMLSLKHVLYTSEVYRKTGGIFNQIPVPATTATNSTMGKLPLKKGMDMAKYGAYNKVSMSFYTLIESTINGKVERTIEDVPLYLTKQSHFEENKNQFLKNYFEEVRRLKNIRILYPEIKFNTPIEIDGLRFRLRGKTGDKYEILLGMQPYFTKEQMSTLKVIYKFSNRNDDKNTKVISSEVLPPEKLTELFDQLIEKLRTGPWKVNTSLSGQAEKIMDKRDVFLNDSQEVQFETIIEIVKLFNCNAASVNLKPLGLSAQACKKVINKKLNPKSSYLLIEQSVTGFFEKKVDLLAL